MENVENAYGRQVLQAKITDLEHRIALKDSQGESGPEFDALHKEHDALLAQLKDIDSGSQDLEKAA